MGLETSLVAVMLGKSEKQTVGAGVLVDDDLILTCAHVVNGALERDLLQTGRPEKGAVIQVRFHKAIAAGNFDTTIDSWTDPPRKDVAPPRGADICLLRLRI